MSLNCEKCQKDFENLTGLSNHIKFCDGTGTNLDKRKKSSTWTCPKCGFHIHSQRERHVEICDGYGSGAHKRLNKSKLLGGRSWAKGRALSAEHRKKISDSLKGKSNPPKNVDEWKSKISSTMKLNSNAGGYRIGSGRSNGSWYFSPQAGQVYLDSSYELRLALFLDKLQIDWVKNTKKFPYADECGVIRNYIPDFYLPQINIWIETKGFKTRRDECKWRDFPFILKILFESDIINLENGVVAEWLNATVLNTVNRASDS